MKLLSVIPFSLAAVVIVGTVRADPEDLTPTESPTTLSWNPIGSDLPFFFSGTISPESDCDDDTHQYVVWKLDKTFAKKNCDKNDVSDKPELGNFQITCSVEVPGLNDGEASAHYYYDSIDNVDQAIKGSQSFKPSYLRLNDEVISFEEESCMDTLKSKFQIIEDRREGCRASHTDVIIRLNNIFGNENCVKAETNDAINCFVEVPRWFRASAEYNYNAESEKGLQPTSLIVTDTYMYFQGSSFQEYTYTTSDGNFCLDDLALLDLGQSSINGIRYRRQNPDQSPVGACENAFQPFPYKNGKKWTSCNDVTALRFNKIQNKCNKHEEIATNCPSLCKKNDCRCENNPVAFAVNRKGKKKTFSCDKLANMNEKKKERNCNRKKVLFNCPGSCNDQCLKQN